MSLTQTLTDQCEELGSKIELINSSIELRENSSPSNTQDFFLRVGKPGRLFLQPNYTAFTKTNLGSIPSKIEKTLLKTETNIPLTTSINNSIISTESKMNSSTINSSIISSKDPKNYSKSFSSKGYGNGFVSKVERFNKYLKEYTPGPGDYYPDKIYTLENEIKKSDLGKSLFLEKTNRSLSLLNTNVQQFFTSQEREKFLKQKDKINKDTDTDKNKEKDKDDNKKGNYYFESSTNRFSGGFFSVKNKNPGPGKYFLNIDYKIKNKNKKSPNFIYPTQKYINPIKFYQLNNSEQKEIGFHIKDKNREGKVANFWRGVPHLGTTYDFGDTITEEGKLSKKKKNITSNNLENVVTMPDLELLKKIRNNKFLRTDKNTLPSISEEKNMKSNSIIRNILKFKKKDLFGLASPRWDQGFFHDNGTHFQVPGPAYYDPRIVTNKKSFNLNKKDFIYTNSVPYRTINGNMISNDY